MSAIRDGRMPIMLDKERHMLFSLNVIDAVQDRFGDLTALPAELTGENSIKNLKWMLTMLLNEGKAEDEPELTEQQVGRMIHMGNFKEVQVAILAALSIGNSGNNEGSGMADYAENDEGEAATGRA